MKFKGAESRFFIKHIVNALLHLILNSPIASPKILKGISDLSIQ